MKMRTDSWREKQNILRDSFIHLKVDYWLIEYGIFNEIIPNCVLLAIFLTEASNNIPDYEGEFAKKVIPKLKILYKKFNP